MNEVERRLEAAAEETRQLARTRIPPTLEAKPAATTRGWLVLAAAFAVVVVVFGVIPWLTDTTDSPPIGNSAPPDAPVETVTTIEEVETTSGTTVPRESCSSDGVPRPPEVTGLPEAVAATREAIIEAAVACDFSALESLAGEDFTTSFGSRPGDDGGVGNLARWEDDGFEEGGAIKDRQPGEGVLGTLLHLLDMPFGTIDGEERGVIYVWPAAFTYGTWEDIPADDVEQLRAIYTDKDLDLLADYGEYIGWRTGIDQDGEWLYFVGGD